VAAAAKAGVDLIQIRERDLDARALTLLVRRCVAVARGTRARVVVNDRADIAIAAGAHGVHLRSDSIHTPAVRTLLPDGALVGRSVHSAREAAPVVHGGGVDYLILGTLFATPSKDSAHGLTPLHELSDARRLGSIPVLAIGGMTVERASIAARAGASGIAAIGLFIPPPGASPDRYFQTLITDLRRAFDTCEAVS
jgi:thiamine-phosphate pyrophosphorylase